MRQLHAQQQQPEQQGEANANPPLQQPRAGRRAVALWILVILCTFSFISVLPDIWLTAKTKPMTTATTTTITSTTTTTIATTANAPKTISSPPPQPVPTSAPSADPTRGPNNAPSSWPSTVPTRHKDTRFELRVPFYMYDNPELNWENATVDGQRYIPPEPIPVTGDGNHADDYYMIRAALHHPMRTYDPGQAQLFFVPTLVNEVLQRFQNYHPHQYFCTSHDINGTAINCFHMTDKYQLLVQINQSLTESPWFQRSNGTDHLIVASHWRASTLNDIRNKEVPDITAFHMCNTLKFETQQPFYKFNRVRMSGFYTGRRCPPVVSKVHDFAMIASLWSDNPWKKETFQSRRDICEWLGSNHTRNISVAACGGGEQCPALAKAKYGFHVRGDTWGSTRLMDTILSRTIPLFTNEIQYEILPPFYPWREVSYLVNVTNYESFFASIDDILSQPQSIYMEKMQLLDDNMHIADHKQPFQFDRYMAELARRLGLQA